MLKKIPSAETRYYEMTKYMSTLIKKAPELTIEVLETPGFRKIDLAKLMPALMDCPDEAKLTARRFVEEHCIKQRRSQESSVHNMCFYLYAKSDDSKDLLTYLKKEEINHNANQAIHFDVTYALNVCKQMENDYKKKLEFLQEGDPYRRRLEERIIHMKKAQITLFGILNVHQKAVELALECNDRETAKEYADKPTDKKVSRDLWMKIAEFLFKRGQGEMSVSDALEFIREGS
jgi:hypothetical protein